MTIANFFIGLFTLAYGIVSLKYNYRYTNMFARSSFIDSWFGSMYTFLKLTSILASVVGLLIMFGLGDNFGNFITKPLQGLFGG